MIDLRSDTVTKPSKEMLQKVLEAEFGDDEYKEDPTVNSLEEYCSELMGFEDGLFVTSGLMGNQISLLIHTNPGEEVITTKDSHVKNYEHGAAAFPAFLHEAPARLSNQCAGVHARSQSTDPSQQGLRPLPADEQA